MSDIKRGRGRPRRQGTDEEILNVARSMLAARGYRDLTIDAIADAAGVAKTTVYRRWPSKGALVAAAIAPEPIAHATTAAQLVEETATILAPLADASDDAEFLGVIRAILIPRRAALVALLGDESRADELLGAVWMRLFMAGSKP